MMQRVTISLLLFIVALMSKAQGDDFSQYLLSSLYLNPAYASTYTDLSVNLNYRAQKTNQIDIQTSQVSIVFPISLDDVSDNVAGVGIMAFNQNSDNGVYSDNGFFLTYSQNISLGLLGSDLIAIGVQAGYSRSTTSLSQYQWGSQYSGFIDSGFNGFSPAPVTEFDNYINQLAVNVGVMYYYNRKRNYLLHNYSAFSGISISNLNRPDDAFSLEGDAREPMSLRYHGGIEVRLNNLYVIPNALISYSRQIVSANAGVQFAYSFESSARFTSVNKGFQLIFGSWYRLRESFTLLGGMQFNSLAIRGSYDMNSNLFASGAPITVSPAYEISILYTLSSDPTLRRMNNALF